MLINHAKKVYQIVLLLILVDIYQKIIFLTFRWEANRNSILLIKMKIVQKVQVATCNFYIIVPEMYANAGNTKPLIYEYIKKI